MEINRQIGGSFPSNKSPLRVNPQSLRPLSQKQATNQNQEDYNEEEEYNRRRQDGIRISMQQPQYLNNKPQSSSLRQQYDSLGRQEGYLSQERQSVAERDTQPPSTHFTLGPQIKEEGSFDPPPHIKEHISNIQNDNQSLMRRLNLVLQELDRVKREKNDLHQRLQYSSEETTDVNKMLVNEDNVDKVNKYMQDDLAYERDRNHKIKQQIKELDLFKNELIRDVRALNEEQDHLARENQDSTYSLQQKLSQVQDLEKEAYFTQEKIRALNIAIENSKIEQMEDNADKDELQRILTQLIQERNDLLSRLEHLTRKYDECVKEISQDRSEMEEHNKQHAKLITAKIIFQFLEGVQKKRLNEGFSEFKVYCSFDDKCHNKLSQLAQIFAKIGNYKLKIALRQWFSNCLKPIQTKQQSLQYAINADSLVYKQKFFRLWRNLYVQRLQKYDSKTKAVQMVAKKWDKEIQIETQRAFSIWKDTLKSFKVKQARVKKLMWKLYFTQLSRAMNAWVNHSDNINTQVRMNLLSKNFSHKQYLTVLFYGFKQQSFERKRKRQNILFHCMKSWKDFLAYQKFIMGSSLAALQFRRECNTSIVKSCFDAMRQFKETQKYLKVNQLLNEEELPLIQQLNEENESTVIDRKFKEKTRACESVKKMMSKQLFGYFQHWKNINEDFKEKLRTTVKDKIIQLYMETIRKAFTHWKINQDALKINTHSMVVEEMQQDQQNLQNEVLELQKDVQQKQEQRDCSQKKSTMKCVLSFQKRQMQLAIGRWRDRINEMNVKQDGADTIVRRLRLRFLRRAFDLYAAGVKYRKKLIVEEERCKLYNRTRDERLKHKVYHAWRIYKGNHTKAKEYWHRCFLRLDHSMKKAAMTKWKEGAQMVVVEELQSNQENVVANIEELNNQIGKMHQDETCQNQQIVEMKGQLTNQARRIISNAFARFYYTNETRGFEKWKEYTQFQKKKERLMKKYLDHMMKAQFYYVKSCFKNWILNSNIQDRKEQVKKEEFRLQDATFQLESQTNNFLSIQQKLNEETEQVKEMQRMYNDRLQKSVRLITNKVHTNHFTTQRRYIFQQWREYVKREVHFINCVKNVIEKSLWSKGFQYIKSFNKEQKDHNSLAKTLEKFRLKFWKRTCGNAFSVWRSGSYDVVTQTIQEIEQATSQLNEEHLQRKTVMKKANANRASKLIVGHNLRNLFQSWKNVSVHLKQQRVKSNSCLQELNYFLIRNALRKWNLRKHATKLARLRVKRLKEKFHRIRLRLFFNAMRTQFNNTRDFCSRISNLANIHDLQGLKSSFNAIKSFATAKQFVHLKKKENSIGSLQQILEGIITRRKKMYLTDLRIRCMNKRKVEKMKGFTILYNIGNQMRHFFKLWKHQSDERTLAKEMYEEGPVREQVFEERINFINLKDFMNEEGYEERDISDALNEEKSRQDTLVLKSVRRMQHYNDALYLKPKVFDRWRQMVHARKLFKYWLGFAHKRNEFIKSDLHYAFDLWKNHYPKRFIELRSMHKKKLDQIVVNNNQKLDILSDVVQDKENLLNHMNDQREVLVDNLIKAQKLALIKWKNCQKQTLHQGFTRWYQVARQLKSLDEQHHLRKNLQFIEELKQRIKSLEIDNDGLASENEELRQFSLDGYEIAKNVQQLTGEREKLSVDLADKSQMIRKLLDENEKLTQKLRYAQDEAQSMIRSTMAGSSGFKTGTKYMPSPLTKSAKY